MKLCNSISKSGFECSEKIGHDGPHCTKHTIYHEGIPLKVQIIKWPNLTGNVKLHSVENEEEDSIPMNPNSIPKLSLDPNDCGLQYMIARHRKSIAERFGVSKDEYPKGLDQQKQFMKMLKAYDPEKYNKAYDIVVRAVDPGTKIVVADDLVDKAFNQVVDRIDKYILKQVDDVGNSISQILNDVRFELKKTIEIESKKLNKVEITHKVVYPDGTKKKIEGIVPEQFDDILSLASQRVNILLVGPTGCGKTHVSSMVADALCLDFSAQSCSAGMSESTFAGWLLPIGSGGHFEYVQSEFVRLYENGGVFLFDELDAADPNTMLFLNQALANGEFYLPQRYTNPRVRKHKDFVAIGAANTYGNGATAMFSGRNIMDGATMDRFRMGIVPMDYSKSVEEKIIHKVVLEWGLIIRRIISDKKYRRSMSTRALIDGTKMLLAGWPLSKIHNAYFSDWSPEDMNYVNNHYQLKVYLEEHKNFSIVRSDIDGSA